MYLAAAAFLAVALVGYYSRQDEISINGHRFRAEYARSDRERAMGLSFRESFCEECAMVFVFDRPDRYSFWMKDMRFDLDIIWARDGRIVDITKGVSRSSTDIMRPREPADTVIEINSGLSDRYSIDIGEKIL